RGAEQQDDKHNREELGEGAAHAPTDYRGAARAPACECQMTNDKGRMTKDKCQRTKEAPILEIRMQGPGAAGPWSLVLWPWSFSVGVQADAQFSRSRLLR